MTARVAYLIRAATEDDADTIAALAADLGYTARPEVVRSRIRAILVSPTDSLIVAVDSANTPIGCLQAHAYHVVESGFRVLIVGLIVSAAFRRRGVGRSLVGKAEEWARSISAEAIVVRSNVKRVESHSFYQALGYVPTKTQVVYRKCLAEVENRNEL
jgi:GNAT superfamily N-acetyltransferase